MTIEGFVLNILPEDKRLINIKIKLAKEVKDMFGLVKKLKLF